MLDSMTRRRLLKLGSLGLAAIGTGALTLRADVMPTEASGELGDYADHLATAAAGERGTGPAANGEKPDVQPQGRWAPTESDILGPFHRPGAPYRGKITPPLEPGDVLLVRGRVWSHHTRRPIAGAVLDIWQANAAGRYDNDDPANPPKPGVFINRSRLVTDEHGRYEYETIRPGRYRIAPDQMRPSHIHYLVRAEGHRRLITQLYFKGDPFNATDPFIKDSLIIEPETIELDAGTYEVGTFDIVLAREQG